MLGPTLTSQASKTHMDPGTTSFDQFAKSSESEWKISREQMQRISVQLTRQRLQRASVWQLSQGEDSSALPRLVSSLLLDFPILATS